ncbi:hypothetical protein AGDE_07543 [Angomonas deanei]|nr:hypothetical protein AGDE_07543 [Angomonas deanei]|eukprot:EPY35189.1 hypothetical protein AGDE_07543 [Angomonas deanei]
MNTFREVFRSSFPKHLRFDKASQILFAECYLLSKQYKNKKYIPKSSVEELLSRYEPLPGAPFLQLPIIRQLCLVRPINSVRVYRGSKSWLYNRSVETEYNKIKTWLAAQAPPTNSKSLSKAASAKLGSVIEREKFEKEVMGNFKVATFYQRGMRLGIAVVLFLLILIYFSVNVSHLVYLWFYYYRRYTTEEVKAYFKNLSAEHVSSEIPSGYEHLLPSPSVRYVDEKGKTAYCVNVVELADPTKNVNVVAIPCPLVGTKSFYEQIGKILRVSDSVLLEGVTFNKIDKIIPAYIFPLKDDTFPSIAAHHRYLNVIGRDGEPPKLYPAGVESGWRARTQQMLLPFELRCVYLPTFLTATRAG